MKRFLLPVVYLIFPLYLLCANVMPTSSQEGYSFLNDYLEASPRSMGMGGVSVISIEPREALYNNPAKLADTDELYFWVPSLNLNMYSVLDTFEDGTMKEIFNSIRDRSKSGLVSAALKYVLNSNPGRNDFAGVHLNAGVIWKGIGLRADFSENIATYKPLYIDGGEWSNYSRYMNARVSGGYGHKFKFRDSWALDIGASFSFDYLKLKTGNMENLIDYMNDEEKDMQSFISNLPDVRGFALPINIGTTVSFPYNFKVGVVAKNILGRHRFKSTESGETVSYVDTNPLSFDFGAAWVWTKNKFIQVSAEADLKDIASCFGSWKKLIKGFHLGTEIGFFNTVFLRGGLNSGYWTAGAGVGFRAFKVDCAYYFKENGKEAGDRFQECLTIRIAFGWM